jgi:hypothetical protein
MARDSRSVPCALRIGLDGFSSAGVSNWFNWQPTIEPRRCIRSSISRGRRLSYGASIVDAYCQVSAYCDRFLKGEKSPDLPVVQSSKSERVMTIRRCKCLATLYPRHFSPPPMRSSANALPSTYLIADAQDRIWHTAADCLHCNNLAGIGDTRDQPCQLGLVVAKAVVHSTPQRSRAAIFSSTAHTAAASWASRPMASAAV